MYYGLLALHSSLRWLALAALLVAIARAWYSWKTRRSHTGADRLTNTITVVIVCLQGAAGLFLYTISPIVHYFLTNFGTAVHDRQLRFFGMEHITVMTTAVAVLITGLVKSNRKEDDVQKHKTFAIWATAGLLLILSSIPWAFSPLVSRPWSRAI